MKIDMVSMLMAAMMTILIMLLIGDDEVVDEHRQEHRHDVYVELHYLSRHITPIVFSLNSCMMLMNIKEQIGNHDLLQLHKTTFLCSRRIPASVVLKCYDWAIEQREKGNCVISGFHSQLEKDVLHYLLKGQNSPSSLPGKRIKRKARTSTPETI